VGKVLDTERFAIWQRDPETYQNPAPHRRDEKIAKYQWEEGKAELYRRKNQVLFL